MGSEIAHVQAKGLVILVKHAWTQNILQNLETQYFTLGQKHQCLMSIKYWGGKKQKFSRNCNSHGTRQIACHKFYVTGAH